MSYNVNINESLKFENINESNDFFNCLIAFFYNNFSIVKLAMKNQADPLCTNPYGCALESAVKDGLTDIVKYIISRTCISHMTSDYLKSLMKLAKENGHQNVVQAIEGLSYYCQSHVEEKPSANDLITGQKLKEILVDIEKEKGKTSCYFKSQLENEQ